MLITSDFFEVQEQGQEQGQVYPNLILHTISFAEQFVYARVDSRDASPSLVHFKRMKKLVSEDQCPLGIIPSYVVPDRPNPVSLAVCGVYGVLARAVKAVYLAHLGGVEHLESDSGIWIPDRFFEGFVAHCDRFFRIARRDRCFVDLFR